MRKLRITFTYSTGSKREIGTTSIFEPSNSKINIVELEETLQIDCNYDDAQVIAWEYVN